MLNEKDATIITEMLAVMPFFPAAGPGRSVIAGELQSMCASEPHARWLVQRMARLYDKWPGLPEMRRVYCAKYKPADGVESRGISEAYPEGIPSERQIEAPPMLALPAGEPQSADSAASEIVEEIAAATRMNRRKLNHVPTPSAAQIAEVLKAQQRNQESAREVADALNGGAL